MSDWGGTNSSGPSVLSGCDLEMPYSNKWRGQHLLNVLTELEEETIRAKASGDLETATARKKERDSLRQAIESSAAAVIQLVQQTRGLNGVSEPPEFTRTDPDTAKAIYQAGVAGMTLLKNERSVLPIKSVDSIAVIGPNSGRAIANGGGSASLNPQYKTTPLDSIATRTSGDVKYALGCDSWKWVPLATDYCSTPDGKPGVLLEYFAGPDLEGQPIRRLQQTTTDLYLWDSPPQSLRGTLHSFRITTHITPKTTGNHTFGFSSVGPGKLLLNGKVFIDNWDWTEAGEAMFGNSQEVVKKLFVKKGVPIEVVVESTNEIRPRCKIPLDGPSHYYGGCRIGYHEERTDSLLEEAVQAAKSSDVAIVVVGLDAEWESEGYDRKEMDLPKDGSQDRLIEAVLEANPNTVVVNQSGSPVTMPWADKVPAIMQAWYQGQEAGNALADVLFGIQSPGGKLPTTFPRRLEDTPAYMNWGGEDLEVPYEEDIFLGYRHYEQNNIAPLFPFGHGLSYTTFAYGHPSLSHRAMNKTNELIVTVPIENTGKVAATEIVQTYVRDPDAAVPRPQKELKAFTKVYLEAGGSRAVSLKLDKQAVGYWDEKQKAWVARKGTYEALIGASSADIR